MDQTQIFELKNTVTEMNSMNGLTSRMGNRAIENAQSVQQTGKKKKSQHLRDLCNYGKDLILASPESHNERRKRVDLKKCLKKYWLKCPRFVKTHKVMHSRR